MIAHCLFEQSGTFKNEFKKLGYEAYDYDILNDFGQTDYVIDLFKEIRRGYTGEPSIFDDIEKDDLIFAFFPCVRFSNQTYMWFQGTNASEKRWSDEQKLEYNLNLHNELNDMYSLVTKLAIICLRRSIHLIIENPYSKEHYLTRYWCIKPKVIDTDRRDRGDYYKKPTQFWFINCEPQNNLIFEAINMNANGWRIDKVTKKQTGIDQVVARSMIHPDYANRFIREFIIDKVRLKP